MSYVGDFNNLSDKDLVKLSIKDANNFYFLMKKYEDKLIRYILRISNIEKESAEDILQEVFIKVYENLNDFDDTFSFSSWIYRITHNMTISHIRKIQVRPKTLNIEDNESINFLNIFESEIKLDKEFSQKELSIRVKEIIKMLPEKYRDIMILRYLEEKDYQEISDILEKSIGTVSILISRAKKQFKELAIKNNLSTYFQDHE